MSDMDCYDLLPQVVRDALKYTIRKWLARDGLILLRQGWGPERLAAFVIEMDAEHAKREKPYG